MTDLYRSQPQYAVIAKRDGHNETKPMGLTFGFTSSPEEQWARVEARLRRDPDMRERFKGWRFLVARVDECIEVRADGCVRVYRNEHKTIEVFG